MRGVSSGALCDVYTLVEYSNNGFGIGVVSCPPGDSPFKYLAAWFEKEGFRYPSKAVSFYRVVDVERECCTKPGVVACGTYYDGSANFGRDRVDRIGDTFEENKRRGQRI